MKKSDVIPFEVKFSQVDSINIDAIVSELMNEGIEVKPHSDASTAGGRVSYHPEHNDGVDLSIEHNPTTSELDVSSVSLEPNIIKIFAVMQRVELTQSLIGTDGNPLLYAFKNEKGYTFDSDEDKKAIKQNIHEILEKFVDQYFSEINGEVATIIVPSGNSLNASFAGWFKAAANARGKKIQIFTDVLDKVTTEVIRDEVIDDARSDFNNWLSKMPYEKALKTKKKLLAYLDDMDANHNGTFSYHFVRDPEIRNHMSMSMKLSKTPSIAREYGAINDCNVLLLDDSVSRGSSMKEAYDLLVKYYTPKSITGLVLFSPNQKTIK